MLAASLSRPMRADLGRTTACHTSWGDTTREPGELRSCPRVAEQVPQRCRTVAETLPQEPCVGKHLTGRRRPKIDQHLANVGPIWPHLANMSTEVGHILDGVGPNRQPIVPNRPIWADPGQYVAEVSPLCGQHRTIWAEFGPKLDSRSDLLRAVGQMFGIVWTASEAAGFAKGNCPGACGERLGAHLRRFPEITHAPRPRTGHSPSHVQRTKNIDVCSNASPKRKGILRSLTSSSSSKQAMLQGPPTGS